MICCEEMNYVDYFALIKNLKHYKPHRKSLIHVVCYTDSQLINKKCITAIQIQYFKLYFSIKNHMHSTSYKFLHLITSTCESEYIRMLVD